MPLEQLREIAQQWAKDLQRIPLERVNDVYSTALVGAIYPPQSIDFGATWDSIAASEARTQEATSWRRHDANVKALPNIESREVPLAARLHNELLRTKGHGVVCDCVPRGKTNIAAQLNYNATAWVCQNTSDCGFYLLVEKTLSAKAPDKVGPLAPKKAATVPPSPDFSQPIEDAAIACDVDLHAMDIDQFTFFKQFVEWWNEERFGTRLTPKYLAHYSPIFYQQLQKGGVAI